MRDTSGGGHIQGPRMPVDTCGPSSDAEPVMDSQSLCPQQGGFKDVLSTSNSMQSDGDPKYPVPRPYPSVQQFLDCLGWLIRDDGW